LSVIRCPTKSVWWNLMLFKRYLPYFKIRLFLWISHSMPHEKHLIKFNFVQPAYTIV